MANKNIPYHFFDANGFEWIYNPKKNRVYMVLAEKELPPAERKDNGYIVGSLEEALITLMSDGYMTKEV